jgi:hypothetical protein
MSYDTLKKRVHSLENSIPAKFDYTWPPVKSESQICWILYQGLIQNSWLPPYEPPANLLSFLLRECSKTQNWDD